MSKDRNDKNVVATYYQLAHVEGKFSKDLKKVIRTRVLVDEDHAKKINKHWKTSGKLYEIDRDATRLNQESRTKQLEERKKNSDLSKDMTKLAGSFKEIADKESAKSGSKNK